MDIDGKMARLSPDEQILAGTNREVVPLRYVNAGLGIWIEQVDARIHGLEGSLWADGDDLTHCKRASIVPELNELQRQRKILETMAVQILGTEIDAIRL